MYKGPPPGFISLLFSPLLGLAPDSRHSSQLNRHSGCRRWQAPSIVPTPPSLSLWQPLVYFVFLASLLATSCKSHSLWDVFSFVLSVYGCFPSTYAYACGGQRRILDLLEPELLSVVSHHVFAGGLT